MKRILKLVFSAVYWGLRGLGRSLGLSDKTGWDGVVHLYYHEVTRGQRDRFEHQMKLLVARAELVDMGFQAPRPSSRRLVTVSFDDALDCLIENAIPVLRKHGIPATIFAPSGLLGQPVSWTEGWYASERIMTAEQLRAVSDDLISVGSHTVSHPSLPDLDRHDARRELQDSRRALEEILDRPVDLLAFPFGRHNDKIVQWCREAGYRRVFSVTPSTALRDPSQYVNPRVPVTPSDWDVEFVLKLEGAYDWVPAAGRLKRRLRGARTRRAP